MNLADQIQGRIQTQGERMEGDDWLQVQRIAKQATHLFDCPSTVLIADMSQICSDEGAVYDVQTVSGANTNA